MDEEVWDRQWNFVGDEEVRQGVQGSYDKLEDLEHGQDALEKLRNPEGECGKSVVGVLRLDKFQFPRIEESKGKR